MTAVHLRLDEGAYKHEYGAKEEDGADHGLADYVCFRYEGPENYYVSTNKEAHKQPVGMNQASQTSPVGTPDEGQDAKNVS